jgi:hypothetical protein
MFETPPEQRRATRSQTFLAAEAFSYSGRPGLSGLFAPATIRRGHSMVLARTSSKNRKFPPPEGLKRLAYRIQELFYGGLAEQAKVHLRQAALNDPVARKIISGAPLCRHHLDRGLLLYHPFDPYHHPVLNPFQHFFLRRCFHYPSYFARCFRSRPDSFPCLSLFA